MTGPAAFKGKAALITGSSSGVGFRVAERLAEAGAFVFINGRSAERGERAAAKLHQTSQDVRFIAGDCASYPDAAAVVDAARSLAGRLDILISAGAEGDGPAPFAEMTPEQIESTLHSRRGQPPRPCARPAERSSSAATSSSGPGAAWARCQARRSGRSADR